MAKKRAKKQTRKNLTKPQKTAKVKRELKKRFKEMPYDKVVKVKKIVTDGYRASIILLDDGSVCMNGQSNITGCIAGYNVYALDVARGLKRLRIITVGEYNAFYDWYKKMSAENSRDSDLHRMKELAEKHGYKLSKKPKGKS